MDISAMTVSGSTAIPLYNYQNKNVNLQWKHIFNNRLNAVFMTGIDDYNYSIASTVQSGKWIQANVQDYPIRFSRRFYIQSEFRTYDEFRSKFHLLQTKSGVTGSAGLKIIGGAGSRSHQNRRLNRPPMSAIIINQHPNYP